MQEGSTNNLWSSEEKQRVKVKGSLVSDYLIVASFSHSSQNEEVVGGITKDNTCQFLLFLKLNKLKVNNHTEP